jgi:hypothetical protein
MTLKYFRALLEQLGPTFRDYALPESVNAAYIVAIVNQPKGGDPVSHCHSPHGTASVSWILSGEVQAA